MICNKCGKQIPEDSIFCELCGAKIKIKKSPKALSKKAKKTICIALTSLCIVAILFGTYFAYFEYEYTKKNMDLATANNSTDSSFLWDFYSINKKQNSHNIDTEEGYYFNKEENTYIHMSGNEVLEWGEYAFSNGTVELFEYDSQRTNRKMKILNSSTIMKKNTDPSIEKIPTKKHFDMLLLDDCHNRMVFKKDGTVTINDKICSYTREGYKIYCTSNNLYGVWTVYDGQLYSNVYEKDVASRMELNAKYCDAYYRNLFWGHNSNIDRARLYEFNKCISSLIIKEY